MDGSVIFFSFFYKPDNYPDTEDPTTFYSEIKKYSIV